MNKIILCNLSHPSETGPRRLWVFVCVCVSVRWPTGRGWTRRGEMARGMDDVCQVLVLVAVWVVVLTFVGGWVSMIVWDVILWQGAFWRDADSPICEGCLTQDVVCMIPGCSGSLNGSIIMTMTTTIPDMSNCTFGACLCNGTCTGRSGTSSSISGPLFLLIVILSIPAIILVTWLRDRFGWFRRPGEPRKVPLYGLI